MGKNGSGFLPSLSEIQNLTDLEEIEAILRDTISRQQALDEEMENHLRESEKLELSLESLETLPIRLKPIYKDARGLSNTINVACNIAENVSKKVRDLDMVRERVKESLKKVTDIIDVKNCIEGVQKAMKNENYEEAASFIERYLHIDVSGISATQLHNAEKELKETVKKKVEEAIKSENEAEILRFCFLHVPLGMKEEGLTRFSHFMRNSLSQFADQNYKLLLRSLQTPNPDKDAASIWVDAFTQLFEHVAGIIQEKSQTVEEKFGPGSTVILIKHLQAQTDVHSSKILDQFLEHFGIKKIVDEFGNQKKRNDAINRDPREIAPILDQMALMSQAAELFDRFIRSHSKEALESAKKTTKQESEPTSNSSRKNNDGLLQVSELNRRMHDLIGQYMLLEEYFMVESSRKAIKMDDLIPDSLTSSSVDHVFYVLQKSSQRALLTSNVNAVCATINIIITVLTRDYKEYLQKILGDQIAKITGTSSGVLPASLGRSVDPKGSYTVNLNNLDISSEYILKLRREIEVECGRVFTTVDVKIKSCLDDVTETSNAFKKILQSFLEQASVATFNKIKPYLDVFVPINYELSDLDFAEREINDPFVEQFIAGVEGVLKPFKTLLTPANYDGLIQIILRNICTKIEHEVLKKKFNQLGGLQFDKELRSLQNYFASLTPKTVRDKFARVTQMAALLYLEKVTEVLDYWGQNSTHMTWRLTPGEVRKVLGLRVDFSKDAIAKLKL